MPGIGQQEDNLRPFEERDPKKEKERLKRLENMTPVKNEALERLQSRSGLPAKIEKKQKRSHVGTLRGKEIFRKASLAGLIFAALTMVFLFTPVVPASWVFISIFGFATFVCLILALCAWLFKW